MSKQERVQLNLRLDGRRELLEAIKAAADEAGLSVNAWAIRAFEEALGLSSATTPAPASATPSPVLEERLTLVEKRLAALEGNQSGELAA